MSAEYKKGPTVVGGIGYEIKLQAIFALSGIQHFADLDWKLSNEYKDASKFDDLVFQLDSQDILLQSKFKHNGNLQENNFLSSNPKNGDFSLAKYILSYKLIQTCFNIKNLILCTNSNIKYTSLFQEIPLSENELIRKVFENCKIYIVNDVAYINKIEEKILEYQMNLPIGHDWKELDVSKYEIEDFFCKFLLIKAKDGNVEKTIHKKLESIKGKTNFPVSSYEYVLNQIQLWHNLKPQKATYMTNLYIKCILYGEKNKQNIESFLDETIAFQEYEDLEASKFSRVSIKNSFELNLINILQGLWLSYEREEKPKDMFFNEILLLNTEDGNVCEELIECFNINRYKFLVIAIVDLNKKITDTLINFEATFKNSVIDKKIIVLSKSDYFNNNNYELIKSNLLFSSLSPQTQNKFKEKQLLFQGYDFRLKDINEENINFDDLIDECVIEKLRKNEVISIGSNVKKLGNLENYYINRRLEKYNESFTENEIFTKCPEKFFVISDQPGSGKSTLLLKLANDWKKKYPDHWIINLNLGVTIQYLTENQMHSLKNLLNFHEKRSDSSEIKLILHLKKVILLDGIDEISAENRNNLLTFIKNNYFSHDVIKIIITTRSYNFILEELKKSFDDLIVMTLESFSLDDQMEFFKKYFKYNLNTEIENAEDFIKTCPKIIKHFLNIPLYLQMIADIYSDNIICRNDNNFKVSLSNTYQLFRQFMERKKEIFIQNKCSCGNNSVLFNILSDTFGRYLEDIQILATRNNFENTSLKDLLQIDIHRNIRDSVLNVGVLEIFNEERRFAHKTFEEYFAAQIICNKLKEEDISRELLKKICSEVFLNMEKINICHFIDCILETESDEYLQNLSTKYRDIVAEVDCNIEKEIFSLSSQGSVHILQLLFDHYPNITKIINYEGKSGESVLLVSAHHLPTVTYWVQKGADIHQKDKNGFSALHYATTVFSNFENFQYQIDDLSKSLLYKKMLRHVNSLHNNLYQYQKIDNYIKKSSNDSQKSLVLQRPADDFERIINYFTLHKLNINENTNIGTTILHYVAYNGLVKEFIHLVNSGADFEARDNYGNNIMHYAVLGGSLEIVEYLYNSRVSLNRANSYGVLPIHFTLIGNSLEVLKYFIAKGTPVESEDSNGRTLIFYVNSATNLDLFKYIVNLGININRKSTGGMNYTALHLASYANALDIVRYLIEECEMEPTRDKSGQYPAHYAASGNAVKILKYFNNGAQSIESIVDFSELTVLHCAAAEDSINAVRYLVEEIGMDLAVKDRSGKLPLHYAAGCNAPKVFKYLIGKGININVTSKESDTVLHYAAGSRSIEIIKYIMSKSKNLIYAVDWFGKHPIHNAAEADFLEGVQYFIENGIAADITDKTGSNVMHFAAIGRSPSTIKYIFDKYPKLYKANKIGKYPIHFAVEFDSAEVLKYLVQNGFDFRVVLDKNITLLHLAASKDSLKCFKFLLNECGMKVKTDKNRRFPMHHAAEGDAIKVIQFCAENSFDMNIVDKEGCSLVHCAASSNTTKTLHYLINTLKMPCNIRDYWGKLPLHHAAEANSLSAIKYLLSAGSYKDAFIQDYTNLTVLHNSATGGATEAFKYFLEECRSTDINTKDVLGRQPIHIAVQRDALNIVKYIFNYDIKRDVVDKNLNNLLHWAAKYDSINVIKYFIEECNMGYLILKRNIQKQTPLIVAKKNHSLRTIDYFGQKKFGCGSG